MYNTNRLELLFLVRSIESSRFKKSNFLWSGSKVRKLSTDLLYFATHQKQTYFSVPRLFNKAIQLPSEMGMSDRLMLTTRVYQLKSHIVTSSGLRKHRSDGTPGPDQCNKTSSASIVSQTSTIEDGFPGPSQFVGLEWQVSLSRTILPPIRLGRRGSLPYYFYMISISGCL